MQKESMQKRKQVSEKGEERMDKKYTCFLGILFLLFSLSFVGCGKNDVFSLEDLRTEDGEFQYKDIPFGSPYEDVIQKMPIEFQTVEVIDSSAVSLYPKENFDFYGTKAALYMDFTEDKLLDTVKIQFELNEGEEQFQKILDDLTELYGEPEISGGGGELFTSEIYSWGKGSTRLQAILMKTESTASALIGVFKMS